MQISNARGWVYSREVEIRMISEDILVPRKS